MWYDTASNKFKANENSTEKFVITGTGVTLDLNDLNNVTDPTSIANDILRKTNTTDWGIASNVKVSDTTLFTQKTEYEAIAGAPTIRQILYDTNGDFKYQDANVAPDWGGGSQIHYLGECTSFPIQCRKLHPKEL